MSQAGRGLSFIGTDVPVDGGCRRLYGRQDAVSYRFAQWGYVMTFSSALSSGFAPVLLRRFRVGIVATFLAGSLSVAGGAPIAMSAANTLLGTSSHAFAYQHPAEDKVAYLHDGSLLVGYFDGNQVVIKHVTNPELSPT